MENKNKSILASSNGDHHIQAFKLVQGRVNKTMGASFDADILYCIEDGSYTHTWPDGTIDTIDMVAGDCFTFDYTSNVSIVSGVFHYNKNSKI